jgi:hypothetical protein
MLITFMRYICISPERYKLIKKSQNSYNQDFWDFFCLLMEGSGSVQIFTNPDPQLLQ